MSDDPRHSLGRRGERLAAEHFERLGYGVLARNHRTRFGELDLVRRGRARRSCSARSRRGGSARATRGRTCDEAQAPAGPAHGRARGWPRSRDRPRGAGAALRRDRRRRSTRAARSSARPPRGGVLMSLARVTTFALDGRRGPARLGRGRHPHRPAGVHDRRAGRQGGARGARARALGDRQLGLRVPAEADHGQPRARLPAQGRAGVRPAARGRAPRRRRAARAASGRGLRGRRRAVADRRACGRSAARSRSPRARAGTGCRGCCVPRVAGARGGAGAGRRGPRVDSLREAVDVLRGPRRAAADRRTAPSRDEPARSSRRTSPTSAATTR